MRSRALVLPLATLALYAAAEGAFRLHQFGPDAVLRPWRYTATPLIETRLGEPYPDPAIAYRLRPSLHATLKGRPFTTSAARFRSPEWPLVAPPGTFRIAVVGASITMGSGVADEEAYPRVLEAWLHAHGRPDVDVLNAGIEGYRPTQLAAAYDAFVAPYRPDVAIVPLYRDEFDKRWNARARRLPDRGHDLYVRAGLERFFLHRALRRVAEEGFLRNLSRDWDDRARGERSDEAREARAPRVRFHEVLRGFVRAREAEGVHVYLPLVPKPRAFKEERHAAFRARVEAWAADLPNVTVLDVRGRLGRAVGPEDRVYLGDDHPSARIHALIGETLGEMLAPHLPGPAR